MCVDATTVTDARSLVRAPIFTAGPMKQNGPTSALSSTFAEGSIVAVGCRFKVDAFAVGAMLLGWICTV